MFLLGGYDCASKPGTDNGDKSKLQFPCHSTFLLRYLMTCEFPLARPLGCRACRSLPSGSLCGFVFVFRPSKSVSSVAFMFSYFEIQFVQTLEEIKSQVLFNP